MPTNGNSSASISRGVVISDTAKLKSLKLRRSQIKGLLTRARNYINEIDADNVSIFELHQRMHRFTESWEQFNAVQMEIEEIETDTPDKHEEEREEFENRYFSITSSLEAMIENKTIVENSTVAASNGRMNVYEMPINQISNVPNDHLRLPRINLSVFSGSIEDYVSQYVHKHDRQKSFLQRKKCNI